MSATPRRQSNRTSRLICIHCSLSRGSHRHTASSIVNQTQNPLTVRPNCARRTGPQIEGNFLAKLAENSIVNRTGPRVVVVCDCDYLIGPNFDPISFRQMNSNRPERLSCWERSSRWTLPHRRLGDWQLVLNRRWWLWWWRPIVAPRSRWSTMLLLLRQAKPEQHLQLLIALTCMSWWI